MRKITTIALSATLLISTVTPALAQEVLGATSNQTPNIPPTSEGPGFILPDSPLFFLDELKQKVRLAFALTDEAKAQTHIEIAGERMAELRYMLDRNNEQGIETDMLGISQNVEAAAQDVHDARLAGHNVTALAESMNTDIKAKQKSLDILAKESSGQLHAWSFAVASSIALAKTEIEKAMPADLAANEAKDDEMRLVVLGATTSASLTPTPTVQAVAKSATIRK